VIHAIIFIAIAVLLMWVASLSSRVRALKKQDVAPAQQSHKCAYWGFLASDLVLNTEMGPILLRVIYKRGVIGEKAGYVVLPKGIVVDELFNRKLSEAVVGYTLNNECLDGLPGSFRIWCAWHNNDMRFRDVFHAVADILGSVEAQASN
jgi:hypothetical protein